MSKRLVLVFCALFVMAACVPAFAAVQNIKVSGDILTRAIMRNDFDLTKGSGMAFEDEISVFNSVVRLRVDADLTDNVSTVVRLINERNWGEDDAATDSDIDLDLAYITLKEFLYSPLTVMIGRQELHFGNDMVMGDGVGLDPNGSIVNSGAIGTNQTTSYTEATGLVDAGGAFFVNGDLAYRKAFDAIRATLDYDPLVIDIVYAKIDENLYTGNESFDDLDLYGINAGYQFDDKWKTAAEAYLWAKIAGSDVVGDTSSKPDKTYTLGARVSTNPTEKLNIQQELAGQFGKKEIAGRLRDRRALASQTMITYVPGWKHDPVIGMVYSYFSGDANVGNTDVGKDYHAWDPMFENQTAGRIINALFPQWNAHNVDLMLTLKPDFLEDVTFRVDWIYQAMSKAMAADSALANDYNATVDYAANKKELGQEIDVTLMYDYTEDVQFGLCVDWFLPGRALTAINNQKEVANEVIASCRVEF